MNTSQNIAAPLLFFAAWCGGVVWMLMRAM
jgi:hypothetical protein